MECCRVWPEIASIALAVGLVVGGIGCQPSAPPPDISEDAAPDPTSRTVNLAALGESIPSLMARAEIPGLSIAVILEGELAWSEGFGVLDSRPDRDRPVSSDTVFEAASLSKPVMALAYLQTLDGGAEELALDRPIAESFAYERVAHDERHRAITPRLVLSHRTGLPNWDREGDLDFARDPGVRYGYSGEGFVYLQRFFEQHVGQPLDEIARRRLFEPLGMSRSGFVWRDDFASSFAEGHNDEGEVRESGRSPEANAAYSLLTTAPDYARFLIQVMNGGDLSPETFDAMLRVQTRMTGEETRTEHPEEVWSRIFWALSWGVQDENDGESKIYWHWGDNGTYRSFVAFDPEDRTGFVYFTNSENGLAIANSIAKPIVGDMQWTLRWLGYDQVSF